MSDRAPAGVMPPDLMDVIRLWQTISAYGRLTLVFEDGRIDRWEEQRSVKVAKVDAVPAP